VPGSRLLGVAPDPGGASNPCANDQEFQVTDRQVLAGRYEIGAVLGRGGMAEVRAGWDLRLGRAVAVKTLLPGLAEQPTIRRRFDGEARAAARLAHPNAVAVFDVGEERGVPFLVMEQVVGPTLEEEMRGGPLDAGRLRRLGEELLAALGAAHSAGLVHRDVKPANVLMAPDGSAKLADFGIAKAVVDEEGAQVDLTTTGQMPGTVAYMAPERLAGRPATVQSDIYSVGVVLYEGLSGTRPFAAPTPIAMVRAIDQASPAPLRDCCPGLDPALVATVERAMARKPEDRFASAAAMSAALRAGAEPSAGVTDAPTVMATPTAVAPVVAVPAASPGQRARHRWAGRSARPRILALATVAGLAVALIAVAVAVGGDDPKTSPGGTPAVTGPPPTVSPPTSENPTSTSTATTRTDGQRRKGKGKD
jgi:serine/threonine protein kinase